MEIPPVASPISDENLAKLFIDDMKESVNDALWTGDNKRLLRTIETWKQNLSYLPTDQQEKMIASLEQAMGMHTSEK